VLHRDLKPSNILVVEENGSPVPKIIDFGIAKVLGDGAFSAEGATTMEGFIKGTPAYMSPEQTRSGDELTVRSDVYSLGALLYELLAGETPLAFMCPARSDLIETLTAIRESEPIAPSAAVRMREEKCASLRSLRFERAQDLSRHLRGDLDAVVLRATCRVPEKRYETAAALADDVERHLRNEPVTARSPSNWYRFGRFVRRHRAAAISGAITAVALVVTAVVSVVSLVRVNASLTRETEARALAVRKQSEAVVSEARALLARDSALDARRQAESLINYMLFDLRSQLEPLGRSGLLAGVAQSANDYFSRQPTSTDNPDLQRNRGVALFNQGFILLARGAVSQALDAFEKAHALMESRLVEAKTDEAELDRAIAVHGLAVALRASGRPDEARGRLLSITEFLRRQHAMRHGEATRLLAANLEQLGELQVEAGDAAAALRFFADEEQRVREIDQVENGPPADLLRLAVACEKVGTALLLLDRHFDALPKF
jgi:tetratricopeptide (TPR) repeat protein